MIPFFVETQIIVTIISGIFSLVSAFGAILLKDYLDRKKQNNQDNTTKRTTPQNTTPKSKHKTESKRFSIRRPLGILFMAFIIGVIGRIIEEVMDGSGAWIALIIMFVIVIAVLIKQKNNQDRNGLYSFQLEILTLWSGFVFGWTLINESFRIDMLTFTVICWLVCALVGGAILHVSNKKNRIS